MLKTAFKCAPATQCGRSLMSQSPNFCKCALQDRFRTLSLALLSGVFYLCFSDMVDTIKIQQLSLHFVKLQDLGFLNPKHLVKSYLNFCDGQETK